MRVVIDRTIEAPEKLLIKNAARYYSLYKKHGIEIMCEDYSDGFTERLFSVGREIGSAIYGVITPDRQRDFMINDPDSPLTKDAKTYFKLIAL